MAVHVTLKDGSVREYPAGVSLAKIAESIGQALARNALAAKFNGAVTDLAAEVREDGLVEFLTFDDEEGRNTLRHTASHIMAQAVKRLFPQAKLAIGPAIADGFYYDFDLDVTLTPEILGEIEKEMDKIIKEDWPVLRKEMGREDAVRFFGERGEAYKTELIAGLGEDAVISLYEQGEFVDLCAGPHVPGTGKVRAVKLLSLAGAYWRGDVKNKMLQRVYGTAFLKKSDLDAYLLQVEEARKRDHRKLGQELKLFVLKDEGPGFPFFLPKGVTLRNALEGYWRELHQKWGYQEIKTPMILNRELWERSGHWDYYRENMYLTEIDEEAYVIKPMNCPGAILVYNQDIHSYRELPIKYAEMGVVHRHELSGALHGLMRVRCFTQDDAHIFMTEDQITGEIKKVIDQVAAIYSLFGFSYHVELSTKPEKAVGDDAVWDRATEALEKALTEKGVSYKVNPGDGAFYGPKIDFHLKDSIGRTWQCGTIQLDFNLPERFDMTYVGADGQKHRPVMVHRTALGSIERFIAILTEHYAGAFPTWLSPVQARILPITDKQRDYGARLEQDLKEAGVRAELDDRSEKINYKIREAQMEKIPYMLVVGAKEAEAGAVSLRARGEGDKGMTDYAGFKQSLLEEIAGRKS
ncbi:MAG: threonine--tRNA ligase [Peptococcaceae bacterium]|jgi:threonyl-tRNA synthetase|nr:threonine--tRNA ligase [Peptococcaceae bacterium]